MLSFRAGRCMSKARLDGKTVIVTGSNTGIGKVTVKEFYKVGAKVIMACRDVNKANKTAEEIKNSVEPMDNLPLGELVVRKLDLMSLKSVKECAKEILLTEKRINILVNNAGVMMCPKGTTEDGYEIHFGVNHLGHFLFTCLLLPTIIKSASARIVNVSSLAHKFGSIHFDDINLNRNFTPIIAYNQSKLANVLFSLELAERLRNKGVNVYSLHPGVVKTELGRYLNKSFLPGVKPIVQFVLYLFQKTPELGAQTTIYCAIDESLENESGSYYSDCKKVSPSANALKADDARKLWDMSVNFVGLGNWDPFTASADELPPMLKDI